MIAISLSYLGNPYLRSRIIKVPDKAVYDLNSELKLICTLDNSSVKIEEYEDTNYQMRWFKLRPNGAEELIQIMKWWVRPFEISLSPLTLEKSGTYKCEVSRSMVNHHHFQLVEIRVRGKLTQNIINFYVIDSYSRKEV